MFLYKHCKLTNRYYLNVVLRRFSTTYLTEHDNWHLKLSLCVERQPLEYSENEVDKLFREFNEFFALKTANSLKIPSLSKIERKITHKFARSKEKTAKPTSDSSTDPESSAFQEDDLESLLSGELDLTNLPRRSRRRLDKDREEMESKSVSDDDLHSVHRLPKSWLFLLLKYKIHSWSLPITDLYFGDSATQTLARICDEQICDSYRPYFLGYCPFTHQKFPFYTTNSNLLNHSKSINSNKPTNSKSDSEFNYKSEIKGEKVFYYRARHLPSSNNIQINNSLIEDYAWCTFQELTERLDPVKFHRVIQSLPLFNLQSK